MVEVDSPQLSLTLLNPLLFLVLIFRFGFSFIQVTLWCRVQFCIELCGSVYVVQDLGSAAAYGFDLNWNCKFFLCCGLFVGRFLISV